MQPGRIVAGLVAVGLLLALPAIGQVTDEELDESRAEVEAVQVELNQLAVSYEAAVTRQVLLEGEIGALERRVTGSRLAIREFRGQINERAADMYMDAVAVGLVTVFGAATPAEVSTRSEYITNLGRQDAILINAFSIAKTQFEAQQLGLRELEAEQESIVAELDVLAGELNGRLEAAAIAYNDLYGRFLEEERQRRIEAERRARQAAEAAARAATSTTVPSTATVPDAPPTTLDGTTTSTVVAPPPDTTGQVCPIDGVNSFTDTWGAPRSGGRFHQGVDMLAARGTPVVAVESGSVLRMRNSNLGGITVWIRGDSGDEFYYAHLDSWAPGLTVGQRVSPGTMIGTVGTSGNAPANVPHVHWEYHPGGGGAVNPTPLARSLCG